MLISLLLAKDFQIIGGGKISKQLNEKITQLISKLIANKLYLHTKNTYLVMWMSILGNEHSVGFASAGETKYLDPSVSFRGSSTDFFGYGIAFYNGLWAYAGW